MNECGYRGKMDCQGSYLLNDIEVLNSTKPLEQMREDYMSQLKAEIEQITKPEALNFYPLTAKTGVITDAYDNVLYQIKVGRLGIGNKIEVVGLRKIVSGEMLEEDRKIHTKLCDLKINKE
jgi:hypothetical protein